MDGRGGSFRRGRRTTLLLASTLLAACASAPGGSGVPGSGALSSVPSQAIPTLANVSLDTGHAARQVIGPAGGSVETTDAAGTRYRLTIPTGALMAATEIVAVPITAVTGLPKEAAVAGGVHLLPEGLTFWAPAELAITLASVRPGGVLPFAYAGDLTEPHGYPGLIDGASVKLGLVHFSGYALLASTDVARSAAEMGLPIPWAPPSGPADLALSVIAAALSGETLTAIGASTNAAMKTWLETGLRPLVLQFRTLATWSESDPWQAKSAEVRGSFLLWQYLETLLLLSGAPVDAALSAQIPSLVISAATHGLSVTNSGCAASTSGLILLRLIDEFAWQAWAATLRVAKSDPTLRLSFVKEHLCAAVVYDPNGGTNFPSGIQAGQAGTLTIHVGIAVDGGQPRFDWRFDVKITPHGTEPASIVQAPTTTAGSLSHTFLWAPTAVELRLDIKSCIPGIAVPACQEAFVVRGAAAVPADIGLSPAYPSVKPGGSVQITPAVTGPSDQSVKWQASTGSITSSGLFTAGPDEGLVRIRATSVADPKSHSDVFVSVWDPLNKVAPSGGVPPLFRDPLGQGFCAEDETRVCAHFGRTLEGNLTLVWTTGGSRTSYGGVGSFTVAGFIAGGTTGTVTIAFDPAKGATIATLKMTGDRTFTGTQIMYVPGA
jgi:hypothetical protein